MRRYAVCQNGGILKPQIMDSLFHFNPGYSISGNHPKYLLIDSDAKQRDSFQAALIRSQASFTVMVAGDVTEAIKIIRVYKYRPTMILLSANTGTVSCTQSVAKLNQLDELSPVPIVVYGHECNDEQTTSLNQLGASYFRKSEKMDQFTTDLHQLLLHYSIAAAQHFRG